MLAPLLWRRLARNRWAMLGLAVVAAVVLLPALAPWLAPADPYRGELAVSLRAPSAGHILGTDAQGRDVLSRVLYGARVSLAVGLVSQGVALLLGIALGLVAGYYGRWLDAAVMRL